MPKPTAPRAGACHSLEQAIGLIGKWGKNTEKRDYQYEIRLNGVELMKGDASSIGVIFGNLDGRNFDSRGIEHQTHAEWLAYMSAEFKTPLEVGDRIEMLSPEASILQESIIGQSIEVDASRNVEQPRG